MKQPPSSLRSRPPEGAEPALSERLRAREWLARAIGLASPMARQYLLAAGRY